MDKILLIVNSDIGRGNTIGSRFAKIASELKNRGLEFSIFARANYSDFVVTTPFYKNYLGRFLNALHIYIFSKLNVRLVDLKLFDFFILQSLKKIDLSEYKVALCGEFMADSIKYLKENNIKVYLDIPIGHDAYNQKLNEMDVSFEKTETKTVEYMDKAIKLADTLLVPSDFVRQTLDMAGFGNKQIRIINFGVDKPQNFGKQEIRPRIEKEPTIFLFAGNVNNRKGIKYLLEAWQLSNLEDAKLVICGRVYKEVKKEIKKYNFDNVLFTGFVNIKSYLKNSHVFIFPSLWEGSAKVVYEAMSYGLPVVTTFNAGSVVEDGKEGFIIPIANSKILAEKIIFFHKDKEEIVSMGENSFDKSLQYPWDKYGKKVVDELLK